MELDRAANDVDFALLTYKKQIMGYDRNARNIKLAYFVKGTDGQLYTLSTLMITSLITIKFLTQWSIHQYGIYRCSNKYYQLESKQSNGIETQLLEYYITRKLLPDKMFEMFKFDLSNSLKAASYSKCMFIYTNTEVEMLESMVESLTSKNDIGSILPYLCYFTKSITLQFYGISSNSRFGFFKKTRPRVAPVNTCKHYLHNMNQMFHQTVM